MKPKILIALPNDSLGGAEQYLKNIAVYYYNQGYSVTVLFLKKRMSNGWSDLADLENVDLLYTSSSKEKFGIFEFLKNVYKYKDVRFKYIFTSHVHLTGAIGFLIKLRMIKKFHFVGRESTSIFHRFTGAKLFFFKTMYFIGYRSIDLLICQTDLMYRQLKIALPRLVDDINVKVISNPINIPNIEDSSLPLPYENFIVAAGRLIKEKGFDILIDTFYKLLEDFPSAQLVILGEGSMRAALTKKVEELNITDKVFFPGFVTNVYPYFHQAKLCVVSSRIEGFPNVLLQMMSQNNKVISTLCAGGIDQIEGIETANPDDIDSLYRAMRNSLLKNDPEIRQLFDKELNSRTMDSFINRVNNALAT